MTTQQQPATSLETPLEIPFNIPLDTLMFAPLAHWAAGYEYATSPATNQYPRATTDTTANTAANGHAAASGQL